LRDTPGAKLAAVASRSLDSATKFGAEYGAQRFHGSYQALADDPEVDVVYIATPHPMHHENAIMCLNGGKAVLVEKPFTMNRRQAEEIIALAREKKLFVMEAMWTRFMPAVVEAKRIVDSGEIGKPANVRPISALPPNSIPDTACSIRELGGGALLDLGIYPLSMSSFFLGAVTGVQGAGGNDQHRRRHADRLHADARRRWRIVVRLQPALAHADRADDFGRPRASCACMTASTIPKPSPSRWWTARRAANARCNLPRSGNGYTHEAHRSGPLPEAPACWKVPSCRTRKRCRMMGTLWMTIRAQIGLRHKRRPAVKNRPQRVA
jgi:hypothetical protein